MGQGIEPWPIYKRPPNPEMSVASDKAKLAAQEQEIAQLRKQLDTSTTEKERLAAEGLAKVLSLQQDLTTVREDILETRLANQLLTGLLDESKRDVDELNNELTLASANAGTNAQPTLLHAGRQYQLTVAAFDLAGTTYQREDVTSDSPLLARLVELRAGILTELNAE